MNDELRDEIREILDDLSLLSSEGVEVAVSLISDALLVRIFDSGEYLFPAPIGLRDGWDYKRAVRIIADYTIREMIPLVFTDVYRDELDMLSAVFSSMDAEAYPDDDDMFFVRVRNECMRLDVPPVRAHDGIVLSEIRDTDLETYAALCRDEENNKYWGYDASEDNKDDTDAYFLAVARREFDSGIAVTLGSYIDDKLIGEAVIYAFDYSGAAQLAVRILPEYQGKGLGSITLSALIQTAKDIGLTEVFAEVMTDNVRSLRMTSRYMTQYDRDGEKVYFKLKL